MEPALHSGMMRLTRPIALFCSPSHHLKTFRQAWTGSCLSGHWTGLVCHQLARERTVGGTCAQTATVQGIVRDVNARCSCRT